MATRKPKKTSDHFIKSLNPRDADTKYLGEEPFFPTQPVEVERRVALARSFAWYNRFYGKKDAKELLAQYCDHYDRPNDAKTLRKVDEKEFLTTFCWLARMKLRGLELTDYEGSTLENEISRLLKVVAKPQLVEKEEKPNNRPNIQELMKEKASEAAGELEGLFDDLITTGKANSKVVDIVSKFNVMPQHIPLIVEIWKRKQTEFDELSQGQDKDLKEAYSHLGKVQIRNIIKFIEPVVRVVGTGWVASAATTISLAADKEHRFALPNTRFLVHQPSGGSRGSASDIKIQAEQIVKMKARINQLIASETGQPVERVAKDTDRDYWMSVDEAIEYGIVGRCINSARDLV
jgi:hypothetical protein